jgi:hypothetical protein
VDRAQRRHRRRPAGGQRRRHRPALEGFAVPVPGPDLQCRRPVPGQLRRSGREPGRGPELPELAARHPAPRPLRPAVRDRARRRPERDSGGAAGGQQPEGESAADGAAVRPAGPGLYGHRAHLFLRCFLQRHHGHGDRDGHQSGPRLLRQGDRQRALVRPAVAVGGCDVGRGHAARQSTLQRHPGPRCGVHLPAQFPGSGHPADLVPDRRARPHRPRTSPPGSRPPRRGRCWSP